MPNESSISVIIYMPTQVPDSVVKRQEKMWVESGKFVRALEVVKCQVIQIQMKIQVQIQIQTQIPDKMWVESGELIRALKVVNELPAGHGGDAQQ